MVTSQHPIGGGGGSKDWAQGKFSTSTNCTKWAVTSWPPFYLAVFFLELFYPGILGNMKISKDKDPMLTNQYNVKRVWKLISDSEKGTFFWKFRLWNTKHPMHLLRFARFMSLLGEFKAKHHPKKTATKIMGLLAIHLLLMIFIYLYIYNIYIYMRDMYRLFRPIANPDWRNLNTRPQNYLEW